MRITTFLVAAATAILPVLARADVPPPPDEIPALTSAHIAGLDFEQVRLRDYGPADAPVADRHPLGWSIAVILNDCDAKHPNCRLARKLGAIDGSVTAVDGKSVAGDIAVVQAAFASAKHHRIHLTITPESAAEVSFDSAPRAKVATGPVTLDVSAK